MVYKFPNIISDTLKSAETKERRTEGTDNSVNFTKSTNPIYEECAISSDNKKIRIDNTTRDEFEIEGYYETNKKPKQFYIRAKKKVIMNLNTIQ